jgi:hypothetical protein
MEVAVAAVARASTVFYRVDLVYTGGGRRARFPAKFKVRAYTMAPADIASFIAAPTSFMPPPVAHVEFESRKLDGSEGATFSGNPNSWHTDTAVMFTAQMGRKTIVTPWR